MQFIPQNGTYVYFRSDNARTIIIATITTNAAIDLNTARFSQRIKGFTTARNVLTGELFYYLNTLQLLANTALVLELLQ